jgi:8-oxo-dGTP diphosphatase
VVCPRIKARFSVNILENSDSELLLLKRSNMTKLGPGLWGFPADHIESGETPEDCALRELEEEIGTDTRFEQLSMLGPIRDSYYGGVYEIYLFHRHWLDGTIKLNHEHSAFAWVSRHDYKNYQVMDGIDEDIRYFQIWPTRFLNQNKLPD